MPLRALWSILLLVGVCRSQSCYFPDGSFADGYTPCFSGSSGSPCCKPDSVCLTNGYCMGVAFPPYTLYRGPAPTLNANTRMNACSIVLYSNVEGNAWYCANSIVANSSTSVGCANNLDPFQIPLGKIVLNKAALANTSCSAEPTATVTIGAASGSSCPTNSATSISIRETGGSRTVAVGVGVGVSLGVLSLVSLMWAVYERRKRQQLVNSTPPTVPMSSDPYTQIMVAKGTRVNNEPHELYNEPHEMEP
ncbi:uncharacterized protein P174DRAFT_458330 [Aspergillus novofumigatus IBT 16806]|uniref:Mid2 domain-containing protein n=1 Tax=Aspergillus novofumigatus (strain IBT 16806) TaxID=1392255 RepID=A0A2I1CJE0_ASPN1|nr:uncharacterized protein P174DRAFT_458330 [Aspergillus novofumigatus IBT 16806]PKX97724.1 hypothetical protein P174DRAFT_458330 [Aspergillus novofumigatus IBT 16806]